ncbi:MAG: T9SS type A sorting domain-containing protein [Saprospiraceae bacterium]|nr:T9SS type A sorting domain-containing protein [Saprospiraceae bacterium]
MQKSGLVFAIAILISFTGWAQDTWFSPTSFYMHDQVSEVDPGPIADKHLNAATNDPNILVVLVDFDDAPADISQEEVAALMNDYTIETHPESGGFKDYMVKNSYGKYNPNCIVTPWMRAEKSYDYYRNQVGGPPSADSIYFNILPEIAEAGEIDLTQFVVGQEERMYRDATPILIITSKPVRAQAFFGKRVKIDTDEFTINFKTYAMSFISQDRLNLGTTLHEYLHTFRLPDLYLTKEPVGKYCIMSHGKGDVPGNLCAWAKQDLGWIEPVIVEENQMGFEIPESNSNPFAIKIYSDRYRDTRYFLIENRVQEGYDQPARLGYSDKIDGSGLVIYHVDESNDHEYVRVIQADGEDHLRLWDSSNGTLGNVGDAGDFFPGSQDVREIDGSTYPSTKSFFGVDEGISIRNISDPGPIMKADIFPIAHLGGTLKINPDLSNIFDEGFSWTPNISPENDSVWAGDIYHSQGLRQIDGFTYDYWGRYTYPDDIYNAQKVNLKLYRNFDATTGVPSDLFYQGRFPVALAEIGFSGTFSTTDRAVIWFDEPIEIPETFFAAYCPIKDSKEPGMNNRIVRGRRASGFASYLTLGKDFPNFEREDGSHWTLHFYASGEGMITSQSEIETVQPIIFPNPADQSIRIVTTKNENLTASIYDVLGRKILEQKVIGGQVQVSQLDPGTYILVAESRGSRYVDRIMIQR